MGRRMVAGFQASPAQRSGAGRAGTVVKLGNTQTPAVALTGTAMLLHEPSLVSFLLVS